MADSEQLTLRLTIDRRTILVWERESAEYEKTYRLTVDRNPPVFLSLPTWYPPGFGYHEGRLAIWSGTMLYSYDCVTGNFSSFDIDDEVHAAYGLGDRWCLVCELSVVLFNPQFAQKVAVYHHHEVLLESWWASGRLFVEDFEGRIFQFDFSRAGSELVSVEGDPPV